MAQSMHDIKRRIKSISSIKKITRAMELVSSAKLTKASSRLKKSRPFYYTILRDTQQLLHALGDVDHSLLEKREINKFLCIVISDDRGMSGGYNNNIVKTTETLINNKEHDVDLILIGRKSINYFKRKDYSILKEYTGISEDPQFDHVQEICNYVLKLYENKKVDKVEIIYTQFVNNISQEPQVVQILPIEKFVQVKERKNKVIDFDPSVEDVLDYLIPKYVASSIYGALVEASCSEQAARRFAMETATDNAEEIIDELKNTYNKARQSAVTTEIAEIISGAQAVKTDDSNL
jgi:F-type H+-transporting ATPase subunit gamma